MKHIACISVKSFQKLRERENVHLLSILNSQDYDDPDKTKPWQFQCGSSFPGPWLKLELNLIPGSQLWMSARDICSPPTNLSHPLTVSESKSAGILSSHCSKKTKPLQIYTRVTRGISSIRKALGWGFGRAFWGLSSKSLQSHISQAEIWVG